MKPALEFLGFASVAALAHLAVFAATQPDGIAAGGAGGAQEITQPAAPLAGADQTIAEMVARWDAPPALVPEPQRTPAAAAVPDALPDRGIAASDAPRLAQPMTPPALRDVLPEADPVPQLFAQPERRDTPRPRARPAAPTPRAAPPPQSGSRAASRAAGQGQAAQQGRGEAQTQSGASTSASQLAQWGGAIRAAIQRQQRSPALRARGVVQLRLQVAADGRLVSVSVAQSSGQPALDAAAISAVQRARLPRAPAGISGSHQFNLPLRFE